MATGPDWKMAAEAGVIGAVYIAVSASLITFNKYLMHEDRFPHAKALAAIHMFVTCSVSLILYKIAPSLYPTMGKAKENWRIVMKYLVPLGVLFALALYCSNKAYMYCSVSFLQFCKESNVALAFALSCAIGLQQFSWKKTAVLAVVIMGCSLCAHGELNFSMVGFLLQITSQFAECTKNIIGEVVMSGSGLKLDVLTYVSFQAPCSLVPLLIANVLAWDPGVVPAFQAHWPMVLLNALNAFFLNLVIATTLKRLSTVAFVIIGIVKDSVIVASSSFIFGDYISQEQLLGFLVTMTGIASWGYLKAQEHAENAKLMEREPFAKPKV